MKENILLNELQSAIWTIMLARGMKNLMRIFTFLLNNICQIVADHDCSKQNEEKQKIDFDVLLTAHLSITLVNEQLDAQSFYFIIRLLQSSTCFEQRRAHHQEVKLY